jgi:histidine triad (HIT) family protein
MSADTEGCAFCRIANGEFGVRFLYEDPDIVAFHDIAPKAPVHVLVIPRRHLKSLAEASPDQAALLGKLLLAAGQVARQLGVAETGYRTVANTGADAGQSVAHLHLHVLAGRDLAWPPG